MWRHTKWNKTTHFPHDGFKALLKQDYLNNWWAHGTYQLLNYFHSWYWSCQPRPVKSTSTKIIVHKLMHDSFLIIVEWKKKRNYLFIQNDILIQICPIYSMSDLPEKIMPSPKSTTRCYLVGEHIHCMTTRSTITTIYIGIYKYRYLHQDRRTNACLHHTSWVRHLAVIQ